MKIIFSKVYFKDRYCEDLRFYDGQNQWDYIGTTGLHQEDLIFPLGVQTVHIRSCEMKTDQEDKVVSLKNSSNKVNSIFK